MADSWTKFTHSLGCFCFDGTKELIAEGPRESTESWADLLRDCRRRVATNDARVLASVARDPAIRIRDIAQRCLLTARTGLNIVGDLESGAYLTRTRVGRTRVCSVTPGRGLRHPAGAGAAVNALMRLLDLEEGSADHDTAGPGEWLGSIGRPENAAVAGALSHGAARTRPVGRPGIGMTAWSWSAARR
jgi:hypothetical protein